MTGRRIRHVNNERRLKDFLSKQSELAKQKEESKRERAEKRRKKRQQLESTHHLFADAKYDEQKQKINNDLEQAIQLGAEKEREKKKRKLISTNDIKDSEIQKKTAMEVETIATTSIDSHIVKEVVIEKSKEVAKKLDSKKYAGWLGCEDLEVSSSSSDEEKESDSPAKSK